MQRLLIIDDAPEIIEAIDIIFTAEGMQVLGLENGAALVQKVIAFSPAVILLDLEVGMEDGRELFNQLKSDPSTKHIPIVIFSGLVEYTDLSDCTAQAVVSKPFEIDQLIATVRRLI